MTLDAATTALIAACVLAYAAAAAALPFRRKAGLAVFGAAWILNAGLFLLNWIAAGEPPFGNMYHVLAVISLCFLPLYLLLWYRDGLKWLAVYFAATPCVPMAGALFMSHGVSWQRMPALQSVWFVPHVMSYVLSYALAAVAFVLTAVASFRKRVLKTGEGFHDKAAYRVLLLSFPFMTAGLLLGAIWADEAWSSYWTWDPKETWSLITWMLYVTYFHCRREPKVSVHAGKVQVLAFSALLVTFLLVNFLARFAGLHSYA